MGTLKNKLNSKNSYAKVILPLFSTGLYTYKIPNEFVDALRIGQRVVLPFGLNNRLYTALVAELTDTSDLQRHKYIHKVLDKNPIVDFRQIKFWMWIADYYMCSIGEVMNAALPTNLKPRSDLFFTINSQEILDKEILSVHEKQVLDYLKTNYIASQITLEKVIPKRIINKILQNLLRRNYLIVNQGVVEKYKPKQKKFIKLTSWKKEDIHDMLKSLSKYPKQEAVILNFIKKGVDKEYLLKIFISDLKLTMSAFNTLEKKGFIKIFDKEINRIDSLEGDLINNKKKVQLTNDQKQAFKEVKNHFKDKDVALLHGITGSGKTEIYIRLMEEYLKLGKQVLYLLPEISLTRHFIVRLRTYFKKEITIFHSKLNENEKVEIWKRLFTNQSDSFKILVGVRSSIFLPFKNLGLIILDEEHEGTYNQSEKSPKYNTKDVITVLAKSYNAKVLMGSATPSFETYKNALDNKFGLVELNKRFNNISLPRITLIDMKLANLKKKTNQGYSYFLIQEIKKEVEKGRQVILFRNRRGYSPFLVCKICGEVVKCKNCDVSLTYYKQLNILKCNICGCKESIQIKCKHCNSNSIQILGMGVEKYEEVLEEILPNLRVVVVDSEAVRKKNIFENLLNKIENKEYDVIIGTQIIAKGIDFSNVSLIGILNSDSMMNYPDFRAYEKAFQSLIQVSGRAGRRSYQGKILVQTFDTDSICLKYFLNYNYKAFYNHEINLRKQYNYPPFTKIIHIKMESKKLDVLEKKAEVLSKELYQKFGKRVMGPTTPIITIIKKMFQKDILIKFEKNISYKHMKLILQGVFEKLDFENQLKGINIKINVDPN